MPSSPRHVAWGACALAFAACSTSPPPTNSPPRDVAAVDLAADAAAPDASGSDVAAEPALDAPAPDATFDAPAGPDAPPPMDAAADVPVGVDAPPPDAPAPDATPDASPPDASPPDATPPDAPAEAGACAPPMMLCAGADGAAVCANVLIDTFHCGRCGVRCCGILRCLAGTCTDARCPPLQTACTSSRPTAEGCYDAPCRDLQSDDANCGACGNACAEGTFCLRGRCEG